MPEYSFFHRVASAAFSNPFSVESDELDTELAGVASDGRHPTMLRSLAAIEIRLRDLSTPLSEVPLESRQAVELTHVYAVFHRFIPAFDVLIRAELEGKQGNVAFAEDVLQELVEAGFTEARSERLLGMMWQLRRAFALVERAMTGRSDSMRAVRVRLWQNIFTHDISLYERALWEKMEDFSVFLLGETGTGKGAAATALGGSGWIGWDHRKRGFELAHTELFLPLNLSQFPEGLVESELFGHQKGAFTGALASHPGIFERSRDHGAIFLDEIGEVSVPIQIKLLRVLQERLFSPVGSHEDRRFSGRVIAATNVPLESLTGPTRLREDFFYRLSSDVIELPPLRQRIQEDPSELAALVQVLLTRVVGVNSNTSELLERVLDKLPRDHRWPGNVRELEQAIRRILVRGFYQPPHSTSAEEGDVLRRMRDGSISAAELLRSYCHGLYDELGTFEAVARKTGLDRRTVKKHLSF
ncbi:MAG: DNA-binding NtrC family response regulator [Bradymonadia bacterium]|jgi:DNA-binding NtrC family response regulator